MAKKAKTQKNSLPVATDMPAPTKMDKDREMRYRAEGALSDIERAEKHRGDKELMGHVSKLAKEKVASLKKIC